MKYTFDDIKNKGLLIYEYIRGSHAYGLAKPDGTSDIDTGGVFIEPSEWINGLGYDYEDQISDEKNDNVWYSLRKYLNLLLKGNPNMLESLFIPDHCIRYEHPIMTEIKKHRDEFVTKECFNSFIGYAVSQIQKARGLNKKIVNPITKRKNIIDFCYTFYRQGSKNIIDWLNDYNLKQEYCGLNNIGHMDNIYGCFYDWKRFFNDNDYSLNKILNITNNINKYPNEIHNMISLFMSNNNLKNNLDIVNWFNNSKEIGYRGIISEKSQDVRLSSIDDKDDKPICWISYNKDAYVLHCKYYKEYKEWEENRNPERYKENLEKDFDRKNMAHCVRLLHMGIEIAKTGKVNVDRTNIDRDFIMNIRLGNTSYDEIIKYITEKKNEMDEAIKNSNLPEHPDYNKINKLLINIRNNYGKTEKI